MRRSMIAAAVLLAVVLLGNAAKAQCPTPLPDPPFDQWQVVVSENGQFELHIMYHSNRRFEMISTNPNWIRSTASENPAKWATVHANNWTNQGWWRIDGCTFWFMLEKGNLEGKWQSKTNGHYIGKPRPSFGETTVGR